ncbi:MAG: LytTR family transcriptional regulator [Muribaculum sp.]|nr:LytTR family transcriptional regulator [Muribaculum sp.]
MNIFGKRLIFTTSTEIVRIPADSVVYVTADGNYSSITMADGEKYILTLQLGQIERRIAEILDKDDYRFIRIGKSLIVNREFIAFINPTRQKMILTDCRSFRHEVSASKEALKALKELLEKEEIK